MCSDFAIRATGLSKTYRIYDHPFDRVRQMFALGSRRHFREFHALSDVSFEIGKGETVGIIGRNGSGKSTLLQLICGILKPTAGSVEVNGRVSALLELGAGFHPEFTGRENVYMQGAIMGLARAEMDARFDDIAAFADIGDFIDQPVKTYSSGMFVRLAFAVMAHVDAGILVIDEALAVGDAQFTQKCMRFLDEFRLHGTLVVVSHDISLIASLTDRAIWLDYGHGREQGQTKGVCDAYLAAMFGVRSSVKASPRSRHEAEPMALDQRRDFINFSNHRNDLEIFHFDLCSVGDKTATARIVDVQLVGADDQLYAWVVGGEPVTLRIRVRAGTPMVAPIIGFTVRDRSGRSVFGDNSYLAFSESQFSVGKDALLEAAFSFVMPRLPLGDYSICAAIAEGSQQQHVMHDWQPDSLIIRSGCSSAPGDLGLPMTVISLKVIPDTIPANDH